MTQENKDEIKKSYLELDKVTDENVFIPEFEIWVNSNVEFFNLLENVITDNLNEDEDGIDEEKVIEIDMSEDDYLSFDDILKSESILIARLDGTIYIHPYLMLAYSMDVPSIKMRLIYAIFEQSDEKITEFLYTIFGTLNNNEDEKESNDSSN